MSREEIVNILLNMRPSIYSIEDIEQVDTYNLINIYNSNRGLDYCTLVIKLQMISVILYMSGPAYTKEQLLLMDTYDVYQTYLKVRGITEKQFEELASNAAEDFKANAREAGHDDYVSFSSAELIVATGVITPEPLYSFEEIQTQSMLKRIDEITKEIAELEEDSLATDRQLQECTNYVLRSELQHDLICNGRKIASLQAEMQQLIANQNGMPRN